MNQRYIKKSIYLHIDVSVCLLRKPVGSVASLPVGSMLPVGR